MTRLAQLSALRGIFCTTILLVLSLSSNCYAQSPLSNKPEREWSPLHILSGPLAIAGGVVAPAGCSLRYTLLPFQGVIEEMKKPTPGGSQAGIAIPFLPFVSATGLIGGTVRGTMLAATGIADTLSFGTQNFSKPVWGEEIYSSLAWCLGGSTSAGREKKW